jgi:hypothetical protein
MLRQGATVFQMSFPFPLELARAGAVYWRVTLQLLIAALVGMALIPGWPRMVLGAIAFVLAADCLFAGWLAHVEKI